MAAAGTLGTIYDDGRRRGGSNITRGSRSRSGDDDFDDEFDVLPHEKLPDGTVASDRDRPLQRHNTREFLADNEHKDDSHRPETDHSYRYEHNTDSPPLPPPQHHFLMTRVDTIEKLVPQQTKRKPTVQPSTILISENGARGNVANAKTSNAGPGISNGIGRTHGNPSPLVQTGPLHHPVGPTNNNPPANQQPAYDKCPYLLWRGGHVWKVPFNGRGAPEHRVVIIKRASFPGVYSRRVSVVDKNGQTMPSDLGSTCVVLG
jgi:hypothetical protein